MSLREKIHGKSFLRHEDVTVPEWDGAKVQLRQMGAGTILRYEKERVDLLPEDGEPDSEQNVRAAVLLLRYTMFDPETGERVFTKPEDDEDLLGKDHDVILRLWKVALKVNSHGEKEVEVAAGKSDAPPSSAPSGA